MSDSDSLRRARAAHRQGHLKEAEENYLRLLDDENQAEEILNALVQICAQLKNPDGAAEYLERLAILVPAQFYYCDTLAKLYQQNKQWDKASRCYQRFIANNPGVGDAYYNAAYNLKKAGHYQQSLIAYQQALDCNISQREEVLTNMAVIYSEHLRLESKAIECLELALKINSHYSPALFNLATLYEEEGDKQRAAEKYRAIIALEPGNHRALARLAEATTIADSGDPIISQMGALLANPGLDDSTRTNLHYALGKVFDDCGDYDHAFENYTKANRLDQATLPAYDSFAQQQLIDQSIDFFTQDWFAGLRPVSQAVPLFICGMFRSGSTLTEQVLASHPQLTAGGERDFFFRLARDTLKPYPGSLNTKDAVQLGSMAQDYLEDLKQAFPDAARVTDKRPDNFLYIGLIKALFPNSKFIHTLRNPRDNCLSIYFLRSAPSMNYATRLSDIAHYYKQHTRLTQHWKTIFRDSIHEVDYDRLVSEPEESVRGLLDFLDLEWSSDCLNFHRLKNRVKTASIWQVRQPMYQSSSGRWKNYEKHIQPLIAEFKQ